LHFVLFVMYLIQSLFEWTSNKCRLDSLNFFISHLVCDTVISWAVLHFLYFIITLRRHIMLLNTSVNEVVVSTVKSECILTLEIGKVSNFFPDRYSVISGVRDILYRHMKLCDILDLINSSYSLQVLALIGSKFVYATLLLYLLFFSIFYRSLFPIFPFAPLITLVSFEVMQLVAVAYCCISASLQLSII
jgi:hypothetical protein